MKMLTKSLIILIPLCAHSLGSAAVTVYTDRLTFQNALSNFYVETFTNNVINGSGMTISSYNGSIGNNQFNDTVADGTPNTTFSFVAGVNGFGGNWDLTPGGPGYGIEFLINGTQRVPVEIPRTYAGQFFGFISTDPFTSVKAQDATYQINSFGLEKYDLDNATYGTVAAVPEPSTYALLLIGLALIGTAVQRRTKPG